jgi:hypothetical protein
LKFLVDMPVTPQAVAYLQAAGHEAVDVSSVGLSSATDTRILEVARDEGRVVVTAHLDYPRLRRTAPESFSSAADFQRGQDLRSLPLVTDHWESLVVDLEIAAQLPRS